VRLRIAARRVLADLRPGASVAVQGVCLTVLDLDPRGFAVAAESETLRLTTLGGLRVGARVNLERALAAGGRLDGHLVQGHVDGTARVAAVRAEGRTRVLAIEVPADVAKYVVPKGSLAVDGVSLTVGPRVQAGRFEVFLIPYTWEKTTLGGLGAGDLVNVETDLVARTVVHWLESGPADGRPESGLTPEALERAFGRGGTP
jgi:riboflavin synthase